MGRNIGRVRGKACPDSSCARKWKYFIYGTVFNKAMIKNKTTSSTVSATNPPHSDMIECDNEVGTLYLDFLLIKADSRGGNARENGPILDLLALK